MTAVPDVDDWAVALLRDMLSIYSPSGQEAALADYLVLRLDELGFRARCDEVGNAVGELGDGPRTLVLLGHMDTVPGFIPVRQEGDRLYGRGAVDAKGPLAAFIAAAAQVGPRPGWRIVVVGVVEEEAATSRGARHLIAHWPAPDACVVGEPSGWQRLAVGYKGRLRVDYALEQAMGHSAGPSATAAEEAVDFWGRLRAWADDYNRGRERQFDQLTPSLLSIHSGDDGFRERVAAHIGLRLPPGPAVEDLKAAIRELARRSARPAEVAFHAYEPAFRADKHTPLVRAFLVAVRAQGARPAFVVKTGTCDANVVGPAWGCPIVVYGPGDSKLDHTPQEHVSLTEFQQAIGVLRRMMMALS
jgi:LysW-gamma-L-lysine carboxypeptidase